MYISCSAAGGVAEGCMSRVLLLTVSPKSVLKPKFEHSTKISEVSFLGGEIITKQDYSLTSNNIYLLNAYNWVNIQHMYECM